MSYYVEIVADSIGPNNARITTFSLRYPRMVHAELMTHRVFSRNASSTRAVPVAKMIEWVQTDPAMPVFWGRNRKGMQATEELTPAEVAACEARWLEARDNAVRTAKALMATGAHKQVAGRVLEPFAHVNVVVTGTSFANFFAQRCHEDAQPDMQVLAVKMARAYRDSTPRRLDEGRWHLPFVTEEERAGNDDYFAGFAWAKVATARCARVSYKTFDGRAPHVADDVRLYGELLAGRHMSPFEHAAIASDDPRLRSGNFVGWHQYRKLSPFDAHERFDFAALDRFAERDFVVGESAA
jgi:thymidylate synthase ThyX